MNDCWFIVAFQIVNFIKTKHVAEDEFLFSLCQSHPVYPETKKALMLIDNNESV